MNKKRDRSNVKRISNDEIALQLGLTLKESRRYTLKKEQLKKLQELTHYKARKSSEADNTDFYTTKHYWVKEKGLSRFVKVEPKESKIDLNYLKKFIKKLNITTQSELKPVKSNKTLRIILTDIHVGMQPNENNYSLYEYTWDAKELEKRRKKLIQDVINCLSLFSELIIIKL